MTPELAGLVCRMMASPPVSWQAVGGGWTQAARWVVRLEDGRSVFVKSATDKDTAFWLRTERRVYEALSGSFMPVCLGWEEGERPVLLLEDLSHAHWPPPRYRDAERFLAVRREELSVAHGNGIYHDAAAVVQERRLEIEIDGDS